MGLYLGPETQDEPTLAVLLEVVTDVGQSHRVPGQGHGDRGSQFNTLGVLGGHHVGQERVVAGFGRPRTGVALGLEALG